MEFVTVILNKFLYPIQQLFIPTSQVYWVYLLSTLLIVLVLYLYHTNKTGEKKSFLDYWFPQEIYLHESAILDYKNYIPSMLFRGFIEVPITAIFAIYAEKVSRFISHGLAYLTGVETVFPMGEPQLWHQIAFTIYLVLITDFAQFYGHYLRHKIPFLWEFHKVHHSSEVLTPLTFFREHPLDKLVTIIAIYSSTSIALALWSYIFGNQMQTLYVNGIPFLLLLFYLTSNFRHSHLWLMFPVWMSHIFISPVQHCIHHSQDPRHLNKNYARVFALWDWMFGTLYVPKEFEQFPVGLAADDEKFDTISSLYLQPFRKIGN